jgi:hypothetical protein
LPNYRSLVLSLSKPCGYFSCVSFCFCTAAILPSRPGARFRAGSPGGQSGFLVSPVRYGEAFPHVWNLVHQVGAIGRAIRAFPGWAHPRESRRIAQMHVFWMRRGLIDQILGGRFRNLLCGQGAYMRTVGSNSLGRHDAVLGGKRPGLWGSSPFAAPRFRHQGADRGSPHLRRSRNRAAHGGPLFRFSSPAARILSARRPACRSYHSRGGRDRDLPHL